MRKDFKLAGQSIVDIVGVEQIVDLCVFSMVSQVAMEYFIPYITKSLDDALIEAGIRYFMKSKFKINGKHKEYVEQEKEYFKSKFSFQDNIMLREFLKIAKDPHNYFHFVDVVNGNEIEVFGRREAETIPYMNDFFDSKFDNYRPYDSVFKLPKVGDYFI